ncbi:hypothetical protein VULLAG_LOCUS11496 [Vulpes lagopus]
MYRKFLYFVPQASLAYLFQVYRYLPANHHPPPPPPRSAASGDPQPAGSPTFWKWPLPNTWVRTEEAGGAASVGILSAGTSGSGLIWVSSRLWLLRPSPLQSWLLDFSCREMGWVWGPEPSPFISDWVLPSPQRLTDPRNL